MDPQDVQQLPAEFLWRRMLDTPPAWAMALPVAFAFLVIVLLALFRREHKLRGLLVPSVIIGVVSAVYVVAGLRGFLTLFSWWYLLTPTLAVALFYVGMMYLKDSQSVHPAIAGFLGLLRCLVYAILAVVFLLPGCQTYDPSVQYAKILMLFDVSGSVTDTRDDTPEPGQDPATLLTRQDKVVRFLTTPKQDGKSFLDGMTSKSPIVAYRFGTYLDESDIRNWKEGAVPTSDAVKAWLNPSMDGFKSAADAKPEDVEKQKSKYQDLIEALKSGTNIGGSALQLAKLEGNGYIQAVVIVSDGNSNVGSSDSDREAVNRFTGGKRKTPIFTIGVGAFRLPAEIRVEDLEAPESARPDDKFPIRVPVVGTGLVDEEFTVVLELQRVKDATGQPVEGEIKVLPVKQGKFQGAGDFPQDRVEYEIDLKDLFKPGKDEKGEVDDAQLEGTWKFTAKVPRHPREAFAKAEHIGQPAEVMVQKRKMRVLLFAGGPTREYQFLRTLLFREVNEKRLELSVMLQTGRDQDHVDQDVEKERFLQNFPNRLGAGEGDKYMSLSDYDVVIAVDPDWLSLDVNQFKLLKDWVSDHSGGIVFVAGPVNTFQLARPAGVDITNLRTLLPVFLNDSRLHGLGGIGHDTTRPYLLHFAPAAKNFDFLRLDEDPALAQNPIAGWDRFFWDDGKKPADPQERPKRGIFNYYPVDKVKATAQVISTFVGPDSSKINDGKDEQPFMVAMPVGNGKSMYVGSGETWRLRHAKDSFHERFWIKMCRYMSAGATQQKKYGNFLMARTVPVGNLAVEARLKGKDLLPLAIDTVPQVFIKRLDAPDGQAKKDETFDLKSKPLGQGGWTGWFTGNVRMKEPGEYEFRIPIPGTNESLTQRLTVRKPNPELDNRRNDFGRLNQIASEAKETLDPLPASIRDKVKSVLLPVEGDNKVKQEPRLFFRIDQAESINDCLKPLLPKREMVKGKLFDLWDEGYKSGYGPSSYTLATVTPLVIGAIGMLILLIFGQYLFAGLFMGFGVVLSTIPVIYDLIAKPNWPNMDLNMSYVLVVVVGLLGVEWLLRKLLKLA